MYSRGNELLRDSERRRVGEKERKSHIVRREDRGEGGYDTTQCVYRYTGIKDGKIHDWEEL